MFKETALGGLAATLTDLVIDIPLSYAGVLYAVQFRDGEGNYIWGYGLGDAIVDAVGGLLYFLKLKISLWDGCWLTD